MLSSSRINLRVLAIAAFTLAMMLCNRLQAQAALLLEEPYGFFGAVNPTGHNAIYFSRICAETPFELRRCEAGESGSVIARYQGIDGYDWVAIPLIPYLYSVENASDVPAHVDRALVTRLRKHYKEQHLQSLNADLPEGGFFGGGWKQLIGTSYERRTYAFRFETTEAQDDALIARLNGGENRTQFNLLFQNCADFAREVLNSYYPGTFRRSIFPDAGITTPKQITYKLARYARKHPETRLTVFEIPQIPGYRRESRMNRGIDESFVTTGYAVPIALFNPYLAGGLLIDYFVRGRYRLIPKNPQVLGPMDMFSLTGGIGPPENAANAETGAQRAEPAGIAAAQPVKGSQSGPEEIRTDHE